MISSGAVENDKMTPVPCRYVPAGADAGADAGDDAGCWLLAPGSGCCGAEGTFTPYSVLGTVQFL